MRSKYWMCATAAAAAQCSLFCPDMLLCCLYVIYSFYSQPVYQALLLISIKEAHFVADAKHLLISYCQSAGQIIKTDDKSLQMLQICSVWK